MPQAPPRPASSARSPGAAPRSAHTREVQEQFESLFQYKAALLLEEVSSILLTPLLLASSLPKCAGECRGCQTQ